MQARWGGVGRINAYLNLPACYFQCAFCPFSSFFKSLLDRHTARYVKQTYCVLFNFVFPGSLLGYIAFLAKNSQAVKHLHLLKIVEQ